MTVNSTSPYATEAYPWGDLAEPGIDSVVLTQGLNGTAWQRLGSTGLWHSVTGRTATWADLVEGEVRYDRGGPLLVHAAPKRKPARVSPRRR